MKDRVSITVENGVADVRLIRADKMNALDQAMFEALNEAAEQVSNDPNVKCVVLSGEGRAFCAGLDTSRFGQMAEGNTGRAHGLAPRMDDGITNQAQNAVWAWRACPVPVIAAVHGVAFGGGFQVCLGADIRIVHPDTKMSVMEIKWGLIPDMAGTTIMRRLAREDVVRELTYTGRIFSGVEAKEYGFATQVSDDPLADALAMAEEIVGKNPDAMRSAKTIMNNVARLSDEDALLQESVLMDELIGSPNQVEAVMAQLEKRAPNFK